MTHPRTERTLIAAVILIAALIAPGLVAVAAAQEGEDAPTGFRAELLGDLERLESKLVGLAEAVPAEKYDWRPAEGIRSVSETYMHVAGACYGILGAIGVEKPEGTPDELEKITTKEDVVAQLTAAFAHLKKTIAETPDSELTNPVELFGMKMNVRSVFYLLATHGHEHLGQSIAYARSIGVVPPWSAAQ